MRSPRGYSGRYCYKRIKLNANKTPSFDDEQTSENVSRDNRKNKTNKFVGRKRFCFSPWGESIENGSGSSVG